MLILIEVFKLFKRFQLDRKTNEDNAHPGISKTKIIEINLELIKGNRRLSIRAFNIFFLFFIP